MGTVYLDPDLFMCPKMCVADSRPGMFIWGLTYISRHDCNYIPREATTEAGYGERSEAYAEGLVRAGIWAHDGDGYAVIDWLGCKYHSTLNEDQRRTAEYKKWRRRVLSRDGYKCRSCGATTDLTAHHIKRWIDFPALRYADSNGLTLCQDCHKATHGNGRNVD